MKNILLVHLNGIAGFHQEQKEYKNMTQLSDRTSDIAEKFGKAHNVL